MSVSYLEVELLAVFYSSVCLIYHKFHGYFGLIYNNFKENKPAQST